MSEETTDILSLFWHIGPGSLPIGPAERLVSALRERGVPMTHCGDVYRGLARLCRSGRSPDRVILVYADALTAAEMEFFEHVARLRLAAEIYVFGSEAAGMRAERAVSAGATAVLTDAHVDQVRARLANVMTQHGERDQAEALDMAAARSNLTSASAHEDIRVPGSAERDSSPSDVTDESDESGVNEPSPESPVVRVPWLRYGDEPKRSRPQRRDDTAAGSGRRHEPGESGTDPGGEADRSAPADQKPEMRKAPVEGDTLADDDETERESRVRQPLLTEDELRALLGEDFFDSPARGT